MVASVDFLLCLRFVFALGFLLSSSVSMASVVSFGPVLVVVRVVCGVRSLRSGVVGGEGWGVLSGEGCVSLLVLAVAMASGVMAVVLGAIVWVGVSIASGVVVLCGVSSRAAVANMAVVLVGVSSRASVANDNFCFGL